MDTISRASANSAAFMALSFTSVNTSLDEAQFFSIKRVQPSITSPSTSVAVDVELKGSMKVGKSRLKLLIRNLKPQPMSKGPGLVRTGISQQVRSKVGNLDRPLVDDEVGQQPGSLTAELDALEHSDMDVRGNSPGTFTSAVGAGDRGTTGNDTQSSIAYRPRVLWFGKSAEEEIQYIDRAINAAIAGAAGVFAIAKVVTVDQDYWHGWTIFEILKYAPIHNWSAYEDALKNNPVLAKMMISGIVYSIGDWIAQCYEGKPILDFDRSRMIRSGFVGFCLHGSLSHFYYHLCEVLLPFKEWWVVPLKVAFDQTVWSGIWNSIYFVTVGLLRFDSPDNIVSELKVTFVPMLTAGWKLWPFAHVITYGVVPLEQRLLWVDCVELVWVTILSTYSNEKAEGRISEPTHEEENTGVMVSGSREKSSDKTNAL